MSPSPRSAAIIKAVRPELSRVSGDPPRARTSRTRRQIPGRRGFQQGRRIVGQERLNEAHDGGEDDHDQHHADGLDGDALLLTRHIWDR